MKRSVKIPILWPIMLLLERETLSTASPPVYQMIIGYTYKLCGYYTNSNGERSRVGIHTFNIFSGAAAKQDPLYCREEGTLINIQPCTLLKYFLPQKFK